MKFLYNKKNHIRHFIIKTFTDVLGSLVICAALAILLLWIIGLPFKWLYHYNVVCMFLFIPLLYLFSDIGPFRRQYKYERNSELSIQPDNSIAVEIVIPDDSYRTLYHVHSVSGVKATRKGIAVEGRITAEYIYDPEIGIYKAEELDRVMIPPYFENMKEIETSLRTLVDHES